MAQVKADNYGNLYIDNPWYIEDVAAAAADMDITITEEQAQDVLYAVANNFDANIGINWEVFYYHLENYRKEDDA
jgi:hypothetical protein